MSPTLLLALVSVALVTGGPALPRTGIAVETKAGVTLVGLDGHVLRALDGWRFRGSVERAGQVELRDGAGRAYELRAGVLARVPKGTVTLPGGYALRFHGSWTLLRGERVVERFPRGTDFELDASATVLSVLHATRDGTALGRTRVLDLRGGPERTLPRGCRVGARLRSGELELCGYPFDKREDASIVRADGSGRRIVAGPADTVVEGPPAGWWRSVAPGPGGRTLLAQWSGLCEVPTAYRLDLGTGSLTALGGKSVESRALGWSGATAFVSLPHSVCTGSARVPGVYAFTGDGRRLIHRLPSSPGVDVRLWTG